MLCIKILVAKKDIAFLFFITEKDKLIGDKMSSPLTQMGRLKRVIFRLDKTILIYDNLHLKEQFSKLYALKIEFCQLPTPWTRAK